jgi:hypothetical protein
MKNMDYQDGYVYEKSGISIPKINMGNTYPGDMIWLCKEQKWVEIVRYWFPTSQQLIFKDNDNNWHTWHVNQDGTGIDGKQLVIPFR